MNLKIPSGLLHAGACAMPVIFAILIALSVLVSGTQPYAAESTAPLSAPTPPPDVASDSDSNSASQSFTRFTTASLTGMTGLNTVPHARMDEAGTVRAGLGTLDPYLHGFIGVQLARPLYISLRQTSESSDLLDDPKRLYPGLDFKLRLAKENSWRPAIAVGINSAAGHKRMAGEYIAASKRWRDLDFTLGLGWGRLGSAGHLANPLEFLSGHFGKERALDGDRASQVNDWFTGKHIGLFGGLSYATPVEHLTLKADWGADRYVAERRALDIQAPGPWSVAFDYAPKDWLSLSAGLAGTDKILARLSLQQPVQAWKGTAYKSQSGRPDQSGARDPSDKPAPLHPHRTDFPATQNIVPGASEDGVILRDFRKGHYKAWARLHLTPHMPAMMQVGRAARHMSNHSGTDIEMLKVSTSYYGLRGPEITLLRKDLEDALIRTSGSPAEIWHNAELANRHAPLSNTDTELSPPFWRVLLDNALSLSEEDSGVLYRSAIVLERFFRREYGFVTGHGLRLDLKDNLHRLRDFKPVSPLPVRSDIDAFSDRAVSLERSYISWLGTLGPNIHAKAGFGYLEEMYGGLGGEILYRPFGKNWAIGAESWQVFKRDPDTFLELGFNGDHLLTGHLKAWYEIPGSQMTLGARVGRYLAEDIGASFSLSRIFKDGTVIEGFLTATDQADTDIFGGSTHLYSGLRLRLPIGNVSILPQGSELRLSVAPQGRDTGQMLDAPLDLYEITEPLSYRHVTQSWPQILD